MSLHLSLNYLHATPLKCMLPLKHSSYTLHKAHLYPLILDIFLHEGSLLVRSHLLSIFSTPPKS